MATAGKDDHWSTEAYQSSAAFVPKLAGKVVEWLDPQPDDRILDIGCGDGVLDVQLAEVLARGSGHLHGIDSSPAMISAAAGRAERAGLSATATFEVLDAYDLAVRAPTVPSPSSPSSPSRFTKVFSNAALHWILRPTSHPPLAGASAPPPSATSNARLSFFSALHALLPAGGMLAFELGGRGNVEAVRAALTMAVARRASSSSSQGMAAALRADPWFFPDEKWMVRALEHGVDGTFPEEAAAGEGEAKEAKKMKKWKVERIETQYRPTPAEEGAGIRGWVELMGAQFMDAVATREEAARDPEAARRRSECVDEVVEVLEHVLRDPSGGGGFTFSYVRLRVLARRL